MDAHRLESVSLFDQISKRKRAQIAQWADEVEVEAGAELVTEGTFAHEFFVIEEGRAGVTQGGEVIRELGPGDFFGEIALLESDHHRTATVTALTPMRLVVMFKREFRSMAAEMPTVADALHLAIRDRLAPDAGGV